MITIWIILGLALIVIGSFFDKEYVADIGIGILCFGLGAWFAIHIHQINNLLQTNITL